MITREHLGDDSIPGTRSHAAQAPSPQFDNSTEPSPDGPP